MMVLIVELLFHLSQYLEYLLVRDRVFEDVSETLSSLPQIILALALL